ncbi:hypothetical protein [Streptomyces sp. NPDC005407]|uniref:hypothetical protein n=1 Tax=Streptomyces sp. NPDC005407 TaxID=3155340 RepID=UPI0033A7D838
MIEELLGHAHIGATVYAHVRLRLQHQAISTLSTALDGTANAKNAKNVRADSNKPPPCAAVVR